MYKVMSLQDDFVNEKPQLQHDLEARGHVCLFLPKFHCELNPIELVWGYAKYRECLSHSSFVLPLQTVQAIAKYLMANSAQQKFLFRSVWTCVM
jgi:transposase